LERFTPSNFSPPGRQTAAFVLSKAGVSNKAYRLTQYRTGYIAQ
jgi:hypothetical protein